VFPDLPPSEIVCLNNQATIPSFPSTPIISGFWAAFYHNRIMSRYGALARSPWDDDHEEDDDDEMNLFESGGGDSKMSSPSTSKAVSGPPTFPPKPVTPTRGTGKGKRTSAVAELTPHGPCAGPSLAGPSTTASQALKAPRVSWASSQASAASPAPPAHSFSEPSVKEPIPPPRHEHTGNLLMVRQVLVHSSRPNVPCVFHLSPSNNCN
jgi:hypothetical protein